MKYVIPTRDLNIGFDLAPRWTECSVCRIPGVFGQGDGESWGSSVEVWPISGNQLRHEAYLKQAIKRLIFEHIDIKYL